MPSSRVSYVANCIDSISFKKLAVIGFDGTPENIKCLNENKISFLISQKPFKQGFDSIKLMVNYLIENNQPSHEIFFPIDILTKENAAFN